MALETDDNSDRRHILSTFFADVLPAPVEGEVFVAASPYRKQSSNDRRAMKHVIAATHTELVIALLAAGANGQDSYFALGRYEPHTTMGGAPGRRGGYVRALKAMWVDIDCGAEKAAAGQGYAKKRDAIAAIFEFMTSYSLPEPTYVIDSGGGIHIYWALESEITPDEWKRAADMLKAVAAAHGFLADPARTADVASVMRAPLTLNHKFETAREVKIKLAGVPVQFATLAEVLAAAHAKHFAPQPGNAQFMQSAMPGNTLSNVRDRPPPETAEEVSRVEAMLAAIPAHCDYEIWRDVVWATASTGWRCAKDLARKWSESAPERFTEGGFLAVWESFDRAGGIGFGTLVYHANRNGYRSPKPERFDWTGADVENGRRFANAFRGLILFVPEAGNEFVFDQNAGWLYAPPGMADSAAKAIRDQMHEEATELYRDSPDSPVTKRAMAEVKRVSKAVNLRAMIQMAMSEPGMTRSLNEFDADPLRLGVMNGVLDLERLVLLPVSPTLLVTKRCNVAFDPAATCPQWEKFLNDVQPGAAVREFLQRWAGYCLTGLVREQKLIFPHGGGANGKSVFVETLAWLMGDYARKVATEMFMQHQRNPQGPSPDIVSLKGMRFVYANETEEGRKLADARIKDMTGGDTLTGRVPYAKTDITFAPTYKLALVGNHKPEISDTSHGMWRRILMVLFEVTIPEGQRDGKLLEKLKYEGAGILNWALLGLRKYLKDGLAIPKEIEAATTTYRDEQDIVGEWIRECCATGPSLKMKKDEAYLSYQMWCDRSGHRPMAKGRLTHRLSDRNYRLQPDKRTIGGIALKQADLATAAP